MKTGGPSLNHCISLGQSAELCSCVLCSSAFLRSAGVIGKALCQADSISAAAAAALCCSAGGNVIVTVGVSMMRIGGDIAAGVAAGAEAETGGIDADVVTGGVEQMFRCNSTTLSPLGWLVSSWAT